ncbi:MAG: hypothetical protein GXO29_01310 [Thermotogae bacterium]|nr:hypothetical protein [Thermotogota bacterium]
MRMELQRIVEKIMDEIDDAEAVLFATTDGLPVVFESRFNPDIVERLAALSAMLYSVSNRAANLAEVGEFESLELTTTYGKMFIYHTAQDLFLTILTSKETNIGLVHVVVKDICRRYREVLRHEIGEDNGAS